MFCSCMSLGMAKVIVDRAGAGEHLLLCGAIGSLAQGPSEGSGVIYFHYRLITLTSPTIYQIHIHK